MRDLSEIGLRPSYNQECPFGIMFKGEQRGVSTGVMTGMGERTSQTGFGEEDQEYRGHLPSRVHCSVWTNTDLLSTID